ncbi:MAG: DUF4442 domain-containing protein [Bacteroidetes bacterium]|jgi:hypothetical protein|nr:DUF4442 domain-containing protein [Bacteroidota bacterium]MBP9136315.1 DUF4442 domain-containing protein [Chitinophagales bacterium]MBK7138660.1 DUF4442 domain-containing protein [Bacteroidota bacterium]MBK7504899.1 DUF4442 domain-containing protein [Bacteroidota bacterium]MBK7640722.1 DUF4442 domain-containing protein [Bacteroidota bacterium]
MGNALFDPKTMGNFRKALLNGFTFNAGLAAKLPMAFISGCRITELNEEQCKVTIPYRWLNNNPFGTTYWAVLGMAAEMASGAILLMYGYKSKPSISTFVIGCESTFNKRALTKVTFVCDEGLAIKEAVIKAIETGEAQTYQTTTKGYDENGVVVNEWKFTWGIKARK